jgi:hypothetical protein
LVLGALLVHGYKGQPYVGWLLACCLVLGLLMLLALVLEAFRLQVRQLINAVPPLACVVACVCCLYSVQLFAGTGMFACNV